MLKTFALILVYAVCINWMISLSIVSQVAEKKEVRLRAILLMVFSGILSGYIIYLL